MTPSEFSNYMLFAGLFAGVIGVINLLRPEKRWLGIGSILLGASAILYRQGVPIAVVAVVCGLAVLSMAKDVGARAGRRAS